MEKQLFPLPELKPVYDKAIWLYLYRDFSGNEPDRVAERTALRLGYSSYPQHHLIHPETLERLTSTGRKLKDFLGAMESTKIAPIGTNGALGVLQAAEQRAARLETKRSVKDALAALDEETDIVVRFRAVQVLAEKKPAEIIARTAALLAVPNDLLRYEICDVLKAHGNAASARELEKVVAEPKDSLNPNVLRIRAVQALAKCGDEASVAVIAPHAAGPVNNGLTRISVDALVEIVKRHKKAKAAAVAALAAAFPEPPTGEADRSARSKLALARQIHKALVDLTGKRVKFPSTYDAEAREKLSTSW
jgi:hypothetical protein